jgi:hypothetical protein
MTDDERVAYLRAQTAAALIEMEAMKAANWMREMQGHTIAYGEDEFLALLDKYDLHHNSVISFFRD